MAETDPKRTRNLIALLIVLTAIAAWVNRDFLRFGGDAEAAERQELSLGQRLDVLKELPGLAIDRPAAASEYNADRNLFGYTDSPEKVAKDRASREQQQQLAEKRRIEQAERRKARQEREATRKPTGPPRPRKPNFNYDYIGYMGPVTDPAEYLAVIEKKGGRQVKSDSLLVVKVGDIIEEKFVVKKIDLDAIVIGFTDPKLRNEVNRETLKPKAGGKGGGTRRRGRRG